MGCTLTSIISLRQLDVGTLPAATQAGRLLTTKLIKRIWLALHFRKNYEETEWWKGDYYVVGHWVAQFGMFGLSSTYSDFP